MRNWLGQDIKVGAIVGRGARDGNTSSFKVGRVLALNEDKRTARIHWLHEPGLIRRRDDEGRWVRLDQTERKAVTTWSGKPSIGSPDIDTLFVLDTSTFDFELVTE
ncbi:hypothetical protein [Nocardia gipuzkoensis]